MLRQSIRLLLVLRGVMPWRPLCSGQHAEGYTNKPAYSACDGGRHSSHAGRAARAVSGLSAGTLLTFRAQLAREWCVEQACERLQVQVQGCDC